MTSRIYPCRLIAIACEKYIEKQEKYKEQNLEKWIKKYSYYTKGFWPFKQIWERDLPGTKYYLDGKLIEDDFTAYYEYYIECIDVSKNEEKVRKMLTMAKSKGSDEVMSVDMNDFNLISVYYGVNDV